MSLDFDSRSNFAWTEDSCFGNKQPQASRQITDKEITRKITSQIHHLRAVTGSFSAKLWFRLTESVVVAWFGPGNVGRKAKVKRIGGEKSQRLHRTQASTQLTITITGDLQDQTLAARMRIRCFPGD